MRCSVQTGFLLGFILVSAQPTLASDCEILLKLERYPSTKVTPIGATCSTFLSKKLLTGVSCHWTYGFRDEAAIKKADALWGTLETCRPGKALDPDKQVNHPDSYDLKQWATHKSIFHVSVKDKTALAKTLVFIRLEGMK